MGPCAGTVSCSWLSKEARYKEESTKTCNNPGQQGSTSAVRWQLSNRSREPGLFLDMSWTDAPLNAILDAATTPDRKSTSPQKVLSRGTTPSSSFIHMRWHHGPEHCFSKICLD